MPGRKEGSSFTGKYDLEPKTARPRSVGPHHVTRDQEDPADAGIDPGTGYANEIAEVNAAAHRGTGRPVARRRSGDAPGIADQARGDEASGDEASGDEDGRTDAMLDDASTARDAPPLAGMAKD